MIVTITPRHIYLFFSLNSNGSSTFSRIDPHQQQHHHSHYMHNFLEQSPPLSFNDSSESHNNACAQNHHQQQQQQQQHPPQYIPTSFGSNSPSVGTYERSHGHSYFHFPQQQPGQYECNNAYQGFSRTNSRANTPVTQPSSCNFGQSINLMEQQGRFQDMNYSSCSLEQLPHCADPSRFSGVSSSNYESCIRGYGAMPEASSSTPTTSESFSCASSSAALTQYSSSRTLNSECPAVSHLH